MKQKFFYLFLISIGFLSACEKEKTLFVNNNSYYDSLPEELQSIHDQLPLIYWGNISVLTDNILRFESIEHFENTYNQLSLICEAWEGIFLQQYSSLTDEELSILEDSLGYNEFQPLIEFETSLGIIGNTLRNYQENSFNLWLINGLRGNNPMDSIIIDDVEQSLFNPYHEVCIGDTIFQFRTDGYVLIPIDSINSISKYRNLSLQQLDSIIPSVRYFEQTNQGDITLFPQVWNDILELSNEEQIVWSVRGKKPILSNNNVNHPKMSSKIINLKKNSSNDSWKRIRKNCAVTSSVQFAWICYCSYSTESNFLPLLNNLPLEEKKRYSRRDLVKGNIEEQYDNCSYFYGMRGFPSLIISVEGHTYTIALNY